MGRRSDHTRDELRALLIAHGSALMAEQGLAKFSGREKKCSFDRIDVFFDQSCA